MENLQMRSNAPNVAVEWNTSFRFNICWGNNFNLWIIHCHFLMKRIFQCNVQREQEGASMSLQCWDGGARLGTITAWSSQGVGNVQCFLCAIVLLYPTRLGMFLTGVCKNPPLICR